MSAAAPLPSLRRRRDRSVPLPSARESDALYLRLPAERTALFRFLLEAYENVAYFTVLDRKEALIKYIFSPHMRVQAGMDGTVKLGRPFLAAHARTGRSRPCRYRPQRAAGTSALPAGRDSLSLPERDLFPLPNGGCFPISF